MLVLFLPPLICSHFSFPKRLEGVDKPIFQDDNNSSQSHIDIETRIDAGIELTSNNGTSSTLRINYEYYMCSVIIKEASFDNNYAFGAVTGGPCGGALYGYCSGMEIHNCKFYKNCAVDGGAISLTECTAFLEANITGSSDDPKTFNSNTAYCFGGAISFEGNINNSKTLQIFNYVFINNTAYEAGGAIQAIVNSDVYIQNSYFISNLAGDQGGALYFLNSQLTFYKNCVLRNKAGAGNPKDPDSHYDNNNNTYYKKKYFGFQKEVSPRFRGRGCGGIAFINYHPNIQKYKTFISYDNSYNENSMVKGLATDLYHENKLIGSSVMVEDYVKWHSNQDYYSSGIESDTAIIGPVEKYDVNISNATSLTKCLPDNYTQISNYDNTSANFTFTPNTNTSRQPGQSKTFSIVDPTNYTYVATPITQLPKQTTSSPPRKSATKAITYSETHSIPTAPSRTLHSTPHSTPNSTPHSTAHSTAHSTPHSTPHSTAHKTPFSTAHSTPHSTAHSTPHSTAHKTPFITVFSTPHSTAHSTAYFTPLSTPYIPPIVKSKPTDVTGESSGYTKSLTEVQYQYHTDYLTNISIAVGNKINKTETNITTLALANTSVLTWVITSGVETTSTVTWTYIESNTTTLTVSTTLVEKNTSIKASEGNEEDNTSTLSLVETKTIVTTYTMTLVMTETNIIIPLDDSTVGSNVKSGTIILIAVLCLVAVFCLAIIGLFLYRKSHNKSSESESSINDDSDLFNDETRQQQTIVTFNADDDNTMLSTFNMGTDNIEDNEESLNDDDEMFLNAEF